MVAIGVTLLVAAAIIGVATLSNQRIEQRVAEEVAASKSLLWRQVTDKMMVQMEGGIGDFERDFELRQALKQSDAAALEQAVASLTNLIGHQGYFDQLYLFNSGGDLLCCGTHLPPADVIALRNMTRADSKPHRAIGRNNAGEPVALVAFTLAVRRNAIGAVVFEKPLTAIPEQLQAIDGSEMFVVSQQGEVVAAVDASRYHQLSLTLPPLGTIGHATHHTDGAIYAAAMLPIRGLDQQPIAHLVSLSDYTDGYAEQHRFEQLAYGAVFLLLMLASAGLYWFMRHALLPLQDAVSRVTALAEGDLNVSFPVRDNDEVGQLMAALQEMVERIRDIISHLHDASHELNSSADDMAQMSASSKQRFAQQQSETSNVDSAVNQLAASAQEVANHTARAVSATVEARQRIENSQALLRDSSAVIELLAAEIDQAATVIIGLAERTQGVSAVLDVIRGIAHQTNLLALNASIEAARAGDHGRGFAVVADEVRQLATRTEQSIEEIEQLIGALQGSSGEAVTVIHANRDRARQSVSHYAETSEHLHAFSGSVALVSDMTHQIASAAEEQSRMAEEIARALESINKLAGETASDAVSGHAHSSRLSELSHELNESITYFRVHYGQEQSGVSTAVANRGDRTMLS